MVSTVQRMTGGRVPGGTVLDDFAFSDYEFRHISSRIKELCGIHLPDNKRMLVYSRLSRRLRTLGLDTFADYIALLDGSEADKELPFAINALTTNLTRFFREPHHFDHLRSMVIPRVFTPENKKRPIRFWSAGCSSGEEPYSIAMTVLDAVPDLADFDFQVLASDIDTDMIVKSKKASYDVRELDSIPEPMRSQDTVTLPDTDERFGITPQIQRYVSFDQINLVKDWSMRDPLDAIFCRNVMIYFESAAQKSVVDRMADSLTDGGFLYLGHSENLARVSETMVLAGANVYRKASSG